MKTIAFFNNKGGVGKTSLVYHLAWMYAEMGLEVIAADLDPQANLTSMFLDESRVEELWADGAHPDTFFGAVQPLLEGTGDIRKPFRQQIAEHLTLIPGDLALSSCEDELNGQWSKCLDGNPRAFRVLSAFWRVLEAAAEEGGAALVLIDVGPNLGAINRAAIIAADHIVVPVAPDLYSLQGMKNLGPTLRRWRGEWEERRKHNPVHELAIPSGKIQPEGYVVMQHAVRLDRPVMAYDRWMNRIPSVYQELVLGEPGAGPRSIEEDPHRLAALRPYRSLMPLAQEARKPMFFLKPADGALGGHAKAVRDCYADFRQLAASIAGRCGIEVG